MTTCCIRASAWVLLGLGIPLWAQTAPTLQDRNSAPTGSQEQHTAQAAEEDASVVPDEGETGPVLPAPLGGITPRLTETATEVQQPNLLTGSVAVNALYLDNAFTTGNKSVGDYQYSVLPGIAFQTFGPQTQWKMSYAGGLTIDQRASGNSQQSHDGVVDFRHQFTRRLQTELRQDLLMTNNPFGQIGQNNLLPTVTGPGELSSFAVPQPVTRIGSISSGNLTYQVAQHSAIGASGSFSLLHFQNTAGLTGVNGTLIDTTNGTGRGFYLNQISRNQIIGTEYQIQQLRFESGTARTVDQVLYLFDGISFHKHMTVSIYAGPDFTQTHNIIIARPDAPPAVFPVTGSVWSLGGGIAYAWRTKRNGFRLSFDRGVTDGGGLGGAVRQNSASLDLVKAFNERWSTSLNLAYSDGRTIGVPSNLDAGRLTIEQATVGLGYKWTREVTLTAQYGRVNQPHAGLFTPTLNPDHNEFLVGFSYAFEKAFPK